jgi:glycosyltransferase involved in cell wall biosynthesis
VKQKILYIATDLDRCEANIILGVVQAGFDVHVVAQPDFRFKALLEQFGVTTLELPLSGRLDLSAILRLRTIFREGHFDVLHFLSARAVSNGLLASVGMRVKRLAYRGTIGHLSRLDPSAWLSFLSPQLDKIVCVSEAVKSYLLNRVAAHKLVVIYKGHDASWYPRAVSRDLKEFGIPPSAFVVACVANMRPVKGIPFLLDAVDLLPSGLNVHLLLIGKVDPSAQKALAAGRKLPGKIHAVGYHENSSLLVSQADCFVLPSVEREGLPKSLLEAMSIGVACIATRVGGMPEVVQDGENGLVVPPSDSAALAKAIERLIADPVERRVLGERARETIARVFTVERSIQETVELYREVLR